VKGGAKCRRCDWPVVRRVGKQVTCKSVECTLMRNGRTAGEYVYGEVPPKLVTRICNSSQHVKYSV